MNQRPQHFRLDYGANLGRNLVFAGLGQHTGSTHFHDSSAHKNHSMLTSMDPPTDWVWVPELNRWALDFDGSNDYVALPFLLNTDPFSVSMWLSLDAVANFDCFIGSKGSNWGATGGWILYYNSSSLHFAAGSYLNGAAVVYSGTTTYRHVVGVWDGTNNRIYLDGVPGTPDTSTPAASVEPTTLGRVTSDSYNTNGRIADCLVWSNRVLSIGEIQQLADPSNVMLDGLILAPRRRVFKATAAPPAGVAPTAVLSGSLVGPLGGAT